MPANNGVQRGVGMPRPRKAVGVPDRNHRKPTPLRFCVDEALPRRHIADMHDACVQIDNGKHRISRTGNGVDPEQRRVRAHQIEVRLAIEQDGGGAGQRRGNAAIEAAQFTKPGNLTLALRIASIFGTGETAHQERDAVIQKAQPGRKLGRLRHRQSEPVLAGVDVQRAAARPSARADESVPLGELDCAVDDGLRIELCKQSRGAGVQPVKNVDDGLRRRRRERALLRQDW
jgi:hypothetical protein